MKIAGKTIQGPNCDFIVIPRPPSIDEGGQEVNNDIVFKAKAVLDYSDFDKLCPRPTPPSILRRGETKQVPNLEDAGFRKSLDDWAHNRTMWMILKSLQETPDLELETVKMDDPSTWDNFETELKTAGFNIAEYNAIMGLAVEANTLNDDKMKEAKARFLAGQAAVQAV